MTPPPRPIERIRQRLGEVRRALVGNAWLLALHRSVALAACGVLLASILLAFLPPLPARTVLLAALALAAALPALPALAAARRFSDPRAVAREAEAVTPALRSDVRTALGFDARQVATTAPHDDTGAAPDTEIPDAANDAALRDALRQRLLRRVADELDNRHREIIALLPRPPIQLPLRITTTATVVLAAMLLLGPAPLRDGFRTLLLGPAAPTATLADDRRAPEPLIEPVDVRMTPPAYTGLGRRSVRGTLGDFRAMPGTEIEWSSRALLPARAARIRMGTSADDPAIPIEILDDGTLRARFTAIEPVEYTVELDPVDGSETLVDPRQRRLTIDRDEPPSVELTEPEEMLSVGGHEVVRFVYSASDDFGLRSIRLVWHFDGDEERRREQSLHAGLSVRSIEDAAILDLAPLGLQPRDTIVAWVEALDNDTVNGPNVGRSRPVTLSVAAPDELNLEILALKEALFEAALAQLGAMLPVSLNTWRADGDRRRLVARERDVEPGERPRALGAHLATREGWTEILGAWRRLVDRMREDPLSTERDTELLAAMLGRLGNLERDQARIEERAESALAGERVSDALWSVGAGHDAEHLRATERAVLLLDDLLAAHRRDLVARTIEELAASRERLRELLTRLRETDDPDLREQILDEIARLENRMRELMQRMRDQIEQAPAEHLNMDAFEPSEMAENLAQMSSTLDSLRDLVEAGDIDAALAALDDLEQGMDPIAQEMGSPGDPGELSELQRAMGELLEEAANLAELERAIETETAELLDDARRAGTDGLQEQVDEAARRGRGDLDELRQQLDALDRRLLSPDAQQRLEEVDAGLERLEQVLRDGDVAGAREVAERQRRGMMEATWSMQPDPQAPARDQHRARREARQAEQALRSGTEAMRRIGEEMRDLQEAAQPRFDAQASERLERLADDQAIAHERLQQLQRRVESMDQDLPGVQQALQPSFDQAGRAMRSAEGQLRRGEGEAALGSEREARQQLDALREQMQQMSSRRPSGQGRQVSRERVEVPEEGETDRRGFRREVQEAMREDRVESYEQDLQRYYERLVR